jgi:hypothetical protein
LTMRPDLNEVVIPSGVNHQFPECCEDIVNCGYGPCITMDYDQVWDDVLAMTYNDFWTILELSQDERLVHAYRRPMN